MLKQEIINFTVAKDEWLKSQNDALNYLEGQKKDKQEKITQQTILELAKNAYIEMKRDETFRNNLKDNSKISFLPVIENVNVSVENLSFDLKVYFLDDLKDFQVDFQPSAKFQYDKNFESKIEEFKKSFMSNYTFYLDTKEPIQDGNIVILEIEMKSKSDNSVRKDTIQVKANKNATTPVEKEIIGLKVGDEKDITNEFADVHLQVKEIKEAKAMPITEENVKLMGLEKVSTLADIEKEITTSVKHQIFSDAVFDYAQRIIKEILVKNKPLEIPEDLLLQTFSQANVKTEEMEQVKAQSENMISQYFWTNLISKRLGLEPTENEMKSEIKLVQNFLGTTDPNQLDFGKIAYVIISKKLGLYYLNKYEPTEFIFVTQQVPNFW
ncbi:trigger factor-related chaperone [Mycoplasma hafezii]|uniref:trigger factor-related chaperone n=1 Tax=Mycoplasma hafezii TaxID=525886 RepID=UPI003CE9E0C7